MRNQVNWPASKSLPVAKTTIFWLVLLVTAGLYELLGLRASFSPALQATFSPVFQGVNQLTLLSVYRKTVNSDLERAYALAQAELADLDQIRAENQLLRERLELAGGVEKNRLTQPILSYAQPMIAAGEEQGVRVGALVLSQGTLLGLVTRVEPKLAHVQLLTDKQALPLLVKTEGGQTGLVRGDGQALLLTEVPSQANLIKGERVVTVGQPGVPVGVLVGTLGEVQTEVTSPVHQVAIDQHVSFYTEQLVEVE